MVKDLLYDLHLATYDSLADEYESRVETLRPVTEYALSMLTSRLDKGSKVLDIGCAVGYTLEILKQSGMQPEGIDISPRMIQYAKARNPELNINAADFLEVQYPNDSYDAALMYAFIHLFPYEQADLCIAKVAKILKPGGLLFIGTTKSSESSEGFEDKSDYPNQPRRFRKRWTPEELVRLLNNHGFHVLISKDIRDEYGKVWMDYIVQK